MARRVSMISIEWRLTYLLFRLGIFGSLNTEMLVFYLILTEMLLFYLILTKMLLFYYIE